MASESRRSDFPVLYTSGSFYEVGFAIGRTFADRIKSHWAANDEIRNTLMPFVETPKGAEFYESTLEVCKQAYPQYIRELQGLADGCGFPFKNLFTLCIQKEILFGLSTVSSETSFGCTTILINRPGCKILAHNEDAYYMVYSYGYMVSARIIENGEEVESFTAYCYPGSLPGNHLSFNRHGMAFSCDGLYATCIVEKAPPRTFVCRGTIKAKNIEEAVRLLKNPGYGSAYSFTVNIVDVKEPSTMWSVEVAQQARESRVHVHQVQEEDAVSRPCHYVHVNLFEHLKGIPEADNLTSRKRKERIGQLKPPRTKEDALAILGDIADEEYPIYRTPSPQELVTTVFSTVIDVLENKCYIYRGNPAKPGNPPLLHLQIKDGCN